MRNIKIVTLGALAILSLGTVGWTSEANAGAAFTMASTTGNSLANPPFTLGWQFTISSPIEVTALGLFDDSQDGLVDSHVSGLWDSSGNLLASTTIQSGTTDPLDAQFRYASITPVELTAGTYFIGAVFATSDDPVLFPGSPAGFATAPQITFDIATFAGGATLADPTATFSGGPGFFGSNFEFTPAPEPASLVVLATGLIALSVQRKRRKVG
jgi:hypothetical protein